MAELHGIFCCPFLPSILIIERVGGMGGEAGWGGVGAGFLIRFLACTKLAQVKLLLSQCIVN